MGSSLPERESWNFIYSFILDTNLDLVFFILFVYYDFFHCFYFYLFSRSTPSFRVINQCCFGISLQKTFYQLKIFLWRHTQFRKDILNKTLRKCTLKCNFNNLNMCRSFHMFLFELNRASFVMKVGLTHCISWKASDESQQLK